MIQCFPGPAFCIGLMGARMFVLLRQSLLCLMLLLLFVFISCFSFVVLAVTFDILVIGYHVHMAVSVSLLVAAVPAFMLFSSLHCCGYACVGMLFSFTSPSRA